MRLLITGGAGFIGSHVLRFLTRSYPDYTIVCADAALTSGFIGLDQVVERAEKLSNTSYGDYLNQIVQSHGG